MRNVLLPRYVMHFLKTNSVQSNTTRIDTAHNEGTYTIRYHNLLKIVFHLNVGSTCAVEMIG